MPLHVRPIAVSIAVICFFGLSLIGWFSDLLPFVCCKRAVIGTLLAYIAGVWIVKAINAILISAMVTEEMKLQEEKNSGSED
jgi:hypothetical protein